MQFNNFYDNFTDFYISLVRYKRWLPFCREKVAVSQSPQNEIQIVFFLLPLKNAKICHPTNPSLGDFFSDQSAVLLSLHSTFAFKPSSSP